MEFWGYAPTVHTAAHALSWYFVNNPPVIAFEPPQSTPPRPWVQNSWDADLPAKATSARDLLERRDAGLYLAQRAAELNTTDPRLCDSDGLMLDPLRPGLPRKPPRTVTSQSKTRERDRDALIGTDSDPWVRWLTTSPDRCTPPLHTCPHSAPASRHGSRDCSTGSWGFPRSCDGPPCRYPEPRLPFVRSGQYRCPVFVEFGIGPPRVRILLDTR